MVVPSVIVQLCEPQDTFIYTQTPGLFLNVHSKTGTLTNLSDELDFDPIVLQPLSRVLQSQVNFPTYSFPVEEYEIFVLFAIFGFVLRFLPGLGVIQHYVDLSGLPEAEEAHVWWTSVSAVRS